jgi:PIN domain nuclease of toxin-antitoxin system
MKVLIDTHTFLWCTTDDPALSAHAKEIIAFKSLPIQISHAVRVHELPPYHNDPFGRMFIAQSWVESLPLVTKDEDIQRYDLETIW